MNDPRQRPMSLIEDLMIDVRIIAATHRNQCTESTSGRFQQKLVYRLSVFPMELLPLRVSEPRWRGATLRLTARTRLRCCWE